MAFVAINEYKRAQRALLRTEIKSASTTIVFHSFTDFFIDNKELKQEKFHKLSIFSNLIS
jgi:hypothetical protein